MRQIAKPFLPWVGGKHSLLPYIFQLLPRKAPRLLEVCGGSGAVTLGLGAGYAPLRVYNDLNADLANLFRCTRDRPLALLKELGFLPLHARADFELVLRFLDHEYDPNDFLKDELQIAEDYFPPMDRQEVKKLLVGRVNLPDVRRAAAYYLSIRYSYSAAGNSFGGHSVELRRFLGLLRRASDALRGVVVESKDCCDVIRQYARPGAVIYADPPYLDAEEMYTPSFALQDHVRLHDCLCAPAVWDSHIVLSYNSHPGILNLFAPEFYIVGFERPNPMARQEDAKYHELLVTNFDPSPMLNRQLSLLELPTMESSDRPELRILSVPTRRLHQVWDWPQD